MSITRVPENENRGQGSTPTGQEAFLHLDRNSPRFPDAYTPLELQSHRFTIACPSIHTDSDLTRFLRGTSAQEYLSFVLFLNQRVSGVSNTMGKQDHRTCHPVSKDNESSRSCIHILVEMLMTLKSWVDDIPPLDKDAAPQRRFGNPAYRTWAEKVLRESFGMMKRLVETAALTLSSVSVSVPVSSSSQECTNDERGLDIERVTQELNSYFVNSFGNQTRIDYGTGHETCFVAMLYCMAKVGFLVESDARDIVLVVFREYLDTVRKIQRVYCLEPAGTRGVWGLDDYQILPFLWGSSQLVDHNTITPSSIQHMEILDAYTDEYLYIGCIKFIRTTKLGPFHETSPMLHDISGLESWSKINAGMIKVYMGELLSKRQVMQHFLLGSVITME